MKEQRQYEELSNAQGEAMLRGEETFKRQNKRQEKKLPAPAAEAPYRKVERSTN